MKTVQDEGQKVTWSLQELRTFPSLDAVRRRIAVRFYTANFSDQTSNFGAMGFKNLRDLPYRRLAYKSIIYKPKCVQFETLIQKGSLRKWHISLKLSKGIASRNYHCGVTKFEKCLHFRPEIPKYKPISVKFGTPEVLCVSPNFTSILQTSLPCKAKTLKSPPLPVLPELRYVYIKISGTGLQSTGEY